MAKVTFQGTAEIKDGLTTSCTSRDFEYVLDEPFELGGKNLGMNPVESILCSLGACKCIVVKSFVRKFNIKLRAVRVVCEGVLDPDGFLGKNPEAKIGFSEIHTKFYIDADNSAEEIAAYIEFVEATCPVQDTLMNPAKLSYEIL